MFRPVILRRVIHVIERHLGLVFVGAFLLGVAEPTLAKTPPWCVMAALALIIFLACFQVEPRDLRALRLRRVPRAGLASGDRPQP